MFAITMRDNHRRCDILDVNADGNYLNIILKII